MEEVVEEVVEVEGEEEAAGDATTACVTSGCWPTLRMVMGAAAAILAGRLMNPL